MHGTTHRRRRLVASSCKVQELRACQKGLSFHVLLSDLSRKANLSYPIYLPELWRQSVSLCLLAIVVHPFCPAHNSHDRLCGAMSAFIPRCQQDP